MRRMRFGRRLLVLFTTTALTSAGVGCGDAEPPPDEPSGTVRQALTGCVKDVEGLGDIGKGWIGVRQDGSLWRGSPAMREEAPVHVAAVGDMDGEGQTPCVLTDDATVWCWGNNVYGQVGNGDQTDQLDPVEITALGSAVAEVASSYDFACARKLDGTVWCWGGNNEGELGDGTTNSSLVPVQVTAVGNTVTQLSVGFYHACVLKADDSMWCWGNNSFGEIGKGDFAGPQLTPYNAMNGIKRMSAGGFFSCAIDQLDTLWCWGDNGDGHLGVGNTTHQPTPQEVTTLGAGVAQVDTAVRSACAIKTDGSVWCWGWQGNGRLGDGVDADTPKLLPAPVSGPLGTGGGDTIHLTEGGACVITTTGDLQCFGGGGFLDGTGASSVPVAVDLCNLAALDSISPTEGTTAGGTVVTFTGTAFSPLATVLFDDAAAASVTYIDDTTIEATTPSWFEDVVDVTVVGPNNQFAKLKGAYQFSNPPTAYDVQPTSGPTAGGTSVTLYGSDFVAPATVTFGGNAASNVVVVDSSTITATTPAHAAGPVDIVVTNPSTLFGTLADYFVYATGAGGGGVGGSGGSGGGSGGSGGGSGGSGGSVGGSGGSVGGSGGSGGGSGGSGGGSGGSGGSANGGAGVGGAAGNGGGAGIGAGDDGGSGGDAAETGDGGVGCTCQAPGGAPTRRGWPAATLLLLGLAVARRRRRSPESHR